MVQAVEKSLATTRVKKRHTLMRVARNEQQFLIFIGLAFFAAGALSPIPQYAAWLGFVLAAYSAIANDSIQTLGTFLASNKQRPWWLLWMFIGGVFLATVSYSWVVNAGDVSYGRLQSRGFAEAPTSFTFLQVAAPIFLLILTRLRMPVSTTFLLLSSFSSEAGAIQDMLVKSLSGYGAAFGAGLVVWLLVSRFLQRRIMAGPARTWWYPLQWLTTAGLWSVWLQQDAANIAVFLPRSLSAAEFLGFAGFIFLGLGILFYLRGDKIQRVVDEKSSVVDVRAATLVDFLYALLLYQFKVVSPIPMSTTWVFIGLLAGRELGMALTGTASGSLANSLRLAGRDVLYAGIGLIVSVALAFAVNPNLIDLGSAAEAASPTPDAGDGTTASSPGADPGAVALPVPPEVVRPAP
ncbi:MAG: hypothetical protein ACK41D_07945 [Rubricoccaceae bacterium]